ncbi:hypothetical protein [Sodalis-like endosymbiont of Proechinophthirus fluctus]|nr:hypothetical protein [Sodalis-like endosymbiont of Proechinophthirus fluctus]
MFAIKELVHYYTGNLLSWFKSGAVRYVDILAGVSLHVAPGRSCSGNG